MRNPILGIAGCLCLVIVVFIAGLGIDAGLAFLVHWVFPAIGFWQAFVVLVVLSFLLGGSGARATYHN